jgi:NADH:ubiquinone oxidoreductase subunit 6 (subunit J)
MLDIPVNNTKWGEVLRSMITRSAMNPILFLAIPVSILFLPAGLYVMDKAPILGSVLCSVPIGVVVCATFSYMYLLFINPNKLQSEEHQIRQQALAFLTQGSALDSVVMEAVIQVGVTNPKLITQESGAENAGQ